MNDNFSKWPFFDEADIEAVSAVLKSGKINRWTGTKNTEFESKICENVNTKYAIALANGSLALELALYALGIGEGDEVITSCRTFIASASSVIMRGATPVVADVDLNSQNITSQTIEKCITSKTKAIIVVHHAGYPCDMDSIMALASKYNLFVIEDCAQAHGAEYKGKPVGSIGHIGAWSYCQDKIITTGGEGGAVTTNDETLWRKMWEYKDHGKSYDAIYNRKHPDGFRWLIESFGSNFRMTEMQAVLGIRAYEKLSSWTNKRNFNANIYTQALSKFDCIRLVLVPEDIVHASYKYYCFVRPEKLKDGWSRDRIMSEICKKGIPCFSSSCWNVSQEKAFLDKGWLKTKEDLPNAYELKDTSLMFLVHPTLEEQDIKKACEVISEVLTQAQK